MNFEWDIIAKELTKQKKVVMDIIKYHYENFYIRVKNNELTISFIVLFAYWIHIKFNLDYSVIYSAAIKNSLFKNYFELIFNNRNFKFFTTKNQDLKFLKEQLPKIIANSSNDIALSISKIFDSYNVSIQFENLNTFVKLILYFFALNDNVKPFNSELRKTLNNIEDYNNNVDIFLFSLEIYRKARDAFAIFDCENLANIIVAINRLTQYLVDK